MPQKVENEEGLEQLEQLEEKILRAVGVLQSARSEKEELARENQQLRHRLAEQEHSLRQMQERVNRYEKDREAVKARVQKILDQVEILTQAATDAS